MFDSLIVVRGGGDLGSGTVLRLWRVGFPVVVLESPAPLAVRRTVSFSEAVYEDRVCVEEAVGVRVSTAEEALRLTRTEEIPVLIDPDGSSLRYLCPDAVVDAVMAKRNTGTHIGLARIVVALGPGFEAGRDVHAVIETNRGPDLGRVIWRGGAAPNSGEPGEIGGRSASRVLRAPIDGILREVRRIGDVVQAGEVIAVVGDVPITAGFTGLVRGLMRDGQQVRAGMKVGDVDPRLDPELCRRVSDKSLAVAGGALEAVLTAMHGRLARR